MNASRSKIEKARVIEQATWMLAYLPDADSPGVLSLANIKDEARFLRLYVKAKQVIAERAAIFVDPSEQAPEGWQRARFGTLNSNRVYVRAV